MIRAALAAIAILAGTAAADPDTLDRLFQVRFQRCFDENGYVRFRHWRIYGERDLLVA